MSTVFPAENLDPDNFNPFTAPRELSLDGAPPDDDVRVPAGEFRVRNQILLVSGDVQLPTICVSTGSTDDLIELDREYQHVSRFGKFVDTALGLVTVPFGILIGAFGLAIDNHNGVIMEATLLLPLAWLFLWGKVFATIREWASTPIRIQYFESANWQKRSRQSARRWRLGLAAVVAVAGAVWYRETFSFVLPIVLSMIVCFAKLKFGGVLKFSKGVYHICGFPTEHICDSPIRDLDELEAEASVS